MSRPETIQDLPADALVGDEVARAEISALDSGSLIYAWGQFAIAAEKAGLVVRGQYGSTRVCKPATAEQLDDRLESAQRAWDKTRDAYDAILATGQKPGDGEWSLVADIRTWSKAEALPLPWEKEA